ncbi:MAG: hydrolase [Candidatus Aenigmarchaeota archaeon]|nr:hydrolase [Candidatus Aenigmarchaeota archaeon]
MDPKELGILDRNKCALIVIDIQDRFKPVIHEMKRVIDNTEKLIKACQVLRIPIVVTEQYPKGLGNTLPEIFELIPHAEAIEKTNFDCFGERKFGERIKNLGITDLILAGIESHVCILKTALTARLHDYNVHVVTDAVSSRKSHDHATAIERMKQNGCFMATTEMIIFQLLEKSDQIEFSEIREIVK